jgi:hypothetical protein
VDASSDRLLFRFAGVAAVVVALAGIPAQLLHPRPDPDVETAFLEEIQASGGWIHIHLIAMLMYCAGVVIYLALYRSITGGDAPRLVAALGLIFGLLGTAFTFSWVAIDGIAVTRIADSYWAASPENREAAFLTASAIEHIIIAYWSLSWVVWFGLPLVLFGSAMAMSNSWPRWLGWIGAAAGASAVIVGVAQLYTSRTFITADVLFPLTGFVSGLWVIAIGLLLWRKAGEPSPEVRAEPRPASST